MSLDNCSCGKAKFLCNYPKCALGRIDKAKTTGTKLVWEETVEEKPLNGHYHPTNDPYRYSLDNNLNPIEMHIIKYITRHRKKGGIRDLKAAKLALERLIEEEEKK